MRHTFVAQTAGIHLVAGVSISMNGLERAHAAFRGSPYANFRDEKLVATFKTSS